jgi:hypothetical protein
MDWKIVKEVRLLLTTLPEGRFWGVLVSITAVILAIIFTR